VSGSVLVLVSPRQRGLDLAAALPELLERTLVVTGGPLPAGSDRVAGHALAQPYEPDRVVAVARELAAGHRVDRVVSFAEADVLPAARLRTLWDLPGQRGASAAAYRDKLLMRRYAEEAGLPGPRFAGVETAADVRAFARAHGLPAVCKPRSASGSVGVRILRDGADLDALPDTLPHHLVESFVPGEVVHVDGLWAGGRPVFALPAAYTELGCLAHLADQGGGSALLSGGHPWHRPLTDALWQVVRALPAAPELVLHAEFFMPDSGPPVLCEIASRLPGHPIPPMLDRALGVSLRDTWLRLSAGLPVDLDQLARAAADPRPVANFGLPPRRGVLDALPRHAPDDCAGWVHDLMPLFAPGERWDDSRYAERKSGDFVLTWTVTADDHEQLARRIDTSAELFTAHTRWIPA
jgi:hypothetical protein